MATWANRGEGEREHAKPIQVHQGELALKLPLLAQFSSLPLDLSLLTLWARLPKDSITLRFKIIGALEPLSTLNPAETSLGSHFLRARPSFSIGSVD